MPKTVKVEFNLQIISNYLINIVGNNVGKVDVVERENKNGEAFKMANFSVVSKDYEGIRYIIIALLMEKRMIFQRTLNREIL